MEVTTAMDWHPIKGRTKIPFHVMKIRSSFSMQTFTYTTNKKQINVGNNNNNTADCTYL